MIKREEKNNFIQLSKECFLFRGGDLNNNSIVFIGLESIFIIDPSYNLNKIIKFLENNPLKKVVIFTHSHWDHIGSNIHDIFNYAYKVLFSEPTKILIDKKFYNSLFFGYDNVINENEFKKIDFIKNNEDYQECKFLLTPGHSIDSMCILFNNYCITGDLIFANSIGRTDFIYSDSREMIKSIKFMRNIFLKNDSLIVIPGHDNYDNAKNILKMNYYLTNNFITKFS